MKTLNLGVLAHIDAGKTSLTERLLFAAGVINEIGSVDAGSTQTDSMELERRRGITIKAAVVSYLVEDTRVNLIDTPGHSDFIAEVERVLIALDGAVLVISAVEGVQAQTRVLMRTLQRLHIPTIIFINKIDRRGADEQYVLREIAAKLSSSIVSMGRVNDIGTKEAAVTSFGGGDEEFAAVLTEVLAERDEQLLADFVDQPESISYDRLRHGLADQTRCAVVHPVYLGSAITGAGTDELISGITELLPKAGGDPDGPVSATVFKVERGQSGEKIAYIRLFSGTIRTRDRLEFDDEREGKVTALSVFDGGAATQSAAAEAGQIAKAWGLREVKIGDAIGSSPSALTQGRHFSPPTLETVVVPSRAAEKGTLQAGLAQLAEHDPLINLRQDDTRGEIFVSLYGEVQKEVIQETLANEFGVEVEFRETTTICIERPNGIGSAAETLRKEPNPFLATVGLRIDPMPLDSGLRYELGIELGSMPFAFIRAVEETVRQTLTQGLHGWQVTDCQVTLIKSGYLARQSHAAGSFEKSMSSTAGDFRNLTPLVLMDALRQAGTTVYEPIQRFYLDMPADAYGPVLPVLARLEAVPQAPEMRRSTCLLEGEIPAAKVHELRQLLPTLTRGEGVLETSFERYQAVAGMIPTRLRTDQNPLNRREYLLHVQRRV